MELEMKDIQAVVVLPFTRTEFRRMLWIPERCFPGDTDILNIHFAVMELLAEDMDLCLVFKNALTIDIDLKVLKSETGEWMDLPMDARLAIPEKTCIKVSLTSPDPLPQIRPPAFPVPAQRPMGGIGRDPRRKPAPDPSILNKRDPRRKNLEVVRSAPVPTEVVKSAPAPLEVLRSAPVPPEVVKSAPEPVPPHEATDLYRPSLNRRDPRKRNFMEPASQPLATQLQPSAGRHPPLILPLQPQQPSLPPLQKPAVEQSKGLSSKDPRLKRFQPPSVARVPEEDEMMNIIKNPSRLSVPVKLPVETSAPRAAAPPLFKPVLVEADTVSLSQILADTDTSTNANNSSVELTSPISQPSFSSMLEVKQDLASITQDLSTGSSTKAVRSPSAAGGSERPLIVVVEPTGGPALTSPGVVSPRPPARSPRDRRISLETGKPEDSDSEGELHIDMGSLEVRRKLSGDSLESPSPSQPSSQGKPSLFLQVPGVQPVTPTTPSRPPVLVSSPSTGELLLPSGGAPALNVIPPPRLIPSISVAEEGPGDHGDVSPTRCSQEKAERTEELWDEIYGEFQKNKSLELHDRESTGSSSPSPPPSSPTKRKILAQEGSLPPSSTQRDPSSSSATPSSSPEPTEIEELKKEVEQSKKTLVQLQKEKEMLINLEKERDRLNSIVEDSAGIQPPEREMEEGELSDSSEEEDDDVVVCEENDSDYSPESPPCEMAESSASSQPKSIIPLERLDSDGEAKSSDDEIEIVEEFQSSSKPKQFKKYWEDFEDEAEKKVADNSDESTRLLPKETPNENFWRSALQPDVEESSLFTRRRDLVEDEERSELLFTRRTPAAVPRLGLVQRRSSQEEIVPTNINETLTNALKIIREKNATKDIVPRDTSPAVIAKPINIDQLIVNMKQVESAQTEKPSGKQPLVTGPASTSEDAPTAPVAPSDTPLPEPPQYVSATTTAADTPFTPAPSPSAAASFSSGSPLAGAAPNSHFWKSGLMGDDAASLQQKISDLMGFFGSKNNLKNLPFSNPLSQSVDGSGSHSPHNPETAAGKISLSNPTSGNSAAAATFADNQKPALALMDQSPVNAAAYTEQMHPSAGNSFLRSRAELQSFLPFPSHPVAQGNTPFLGPSAERTKDPGFLYPSQRVPEDFVPFTNPAKPMSENLPFTSQAKPMLGNALPFTNPNKPILGNITPFTIPHKSILGNPSAFANSSKPFPENTFPFINPTNPALSNTIPFTNQSTTITKHSPQLGVNMARINSSFASSELSSAKKPVDRSSPFHNPFQLNPGRDIVFSSLGKHGAQNSTGRSESFFQSSNQSTAIGKLAISNPLGGSETNPNLCGSTGRPPSNRGRTLLANPPKVIPSLMAIKLPPIEIDPGGRGGLTTNSGGLTANTETIDELSPFSPVNCWNMSNPNDSPAQERAGDKLPKSATTSGKNASSGGAVAGAAKVRSSEPRERRSVDDRNDRDRRGKSLHEPRGRSERRDRSRTRDHSRSRDRSSRKRSRDKTDRRSRSSRSRSRGKKSRHRVRSRSGSRDRKRKKDIPRSIGKEDKDNLMLHFYEGDECDFEDPGDPDAEMVETENKEPAIAEVTAESIKNLNPPPAAAAEEVEKVDPVATTQRSMLNETFGLGAWLSNLNKLKETQPQEAEPSKPESGGGVVPEFPIPVPIIKKPFDQPIVKFNSQEGEVYTATMGLKHKQPVAALHEFCLKMKYDKPNFKERMTAGLWSYEVEVAGQTFVCSAGKTKKKDARAEAARFTLKEMGLIIK